MNKLLPISILCALSLAACGDRDHANTDIAPPAASDTTAAMPATQSPPADTANNGQAQQGDGFALGLLATIDQNEIDAARQARDKKVTGDVLAFADMMEKDHGMNLAKTQALGPSMEDPAIDAMKAKGKAELDALAGKSGADYEKAYIEAMVNGHREALDAIDGKMMPAATRDDVKQHLADTRKAVETHLAKAKEIAQKQ
jgi:predicted outer membrane protein